MVPVCWPRWCVYQSPSRPQQLPIEYTRIQNIYAAFFELNFLNTWSLTLSSSSLSLRVPPPETPSSCGIAGKYYNFPSWSVFKHWRLEEYHAIGQSIFSQITNGIPPSSEYTKICPKSPFLVFHLCHCCMFPTCELLLLILASASTVFTLTCSLFSLNSKSSPTGSGFSAIWRRRASRERSDSRCSFAASWKKRYSFWNYTVFPKNVFPIVFFKSRQKKQCSCYKCLRN